MGSLLPDYISLLPVIWRFMTVLLLYSRQNAMRLQEKERCEREQLQQIIDDADDYKDAQKAKRVTNREAQMKNNRDKERVSVLSVIACGTYLPRLV